MRGRWISYLTGAALVAALVGTAPAQAQTPAEQTFSGYSTGTVLHVDAAAKAVVVDDAWSGASVASKGTGTVKEGPGAAAGTINNEMTELVQPTLPNTALDKNLTGNKSFARGSGLELLGAIQLPSVVQASAPASKTVNDELLQVPANPVAWASAVKASAQANWDDNTCILGKPISEGLGYATDAQVLTSGTVGPDGSSPGGLVTTDMGAPISKRVDQSISRTQLVPQTKSDQKTIVGNKLALRAETRQIIAPVTINKGTPDAINVEVGGEWVLQAVAGGVPGSAYIQYGPAPGTSPETPILKVTQGGVLQGQLLFQDLLDNTGLNIPIPGVADISIGEAPRMINGPYGSKPTIAGDATSAAAAVDVVRIKLVDGDLADIRIGHMEAKVTVPAGGISCEIPVKKDADPREVLAGQKFVYNIDVTNPFDCELRNVKVVDNITVDPGIKYTIGDPTPTGFAKRADGVTWANIGTIAAKGTKRLTIPIEISGDSAAGKMHNTAIVTGDCAFGQASGAAGVVVPLAGQVRVELPQVNAPELPQTGGDDSRLAVFAGILLVGALALRRPVVRAAAARRHR